MDRIIIYHGSNKIIREPQFGMGNIHNDYGQAFYCVQSLDMAKEWANKVGTNGFANKYSFDGRGLNILDLTSNKYGVLNWIAILMHHRELTNAQRALYRRRLDFLEKNFYIDVSKYDVVIGYRADDAYFKFPMYFVQNELSVERLEEIYNLGNLGTQIAIISKKAFSRLKFISVINVEPIYQERYFMRKSEADIRFEKIYEEEINSDKARIEDLMREYDKR